MVAPKTTSLAFPGSLNYLAIPKSVAFYSPKLGAILLLLRLYIVIFLLAAYIFDFSWTYAHVVPEGFVSYWGSPNWSYYRQTVKQEAQDAMCRTAPDFDYEWHDQSVHPEGCIDLLPGDTWIKGDTSMFVPTYLEDVWIEQTAGDECQKLKQCCGKTAASASGDLGGGYTCANHGYVTGKFEMLGSKNAHGDELCRCQKEASFFVKGADGLKVTLNPSFIAEMGKSKVAGTTSNVQDNILTLITMPAHTNADGTTSNEVSTDMDHEASLLEQEEQNSPRPSRIMRRPGKKASEQESSMLTVEDFHGAGMTILDAVKVGSEALQEETSQIYEDFAGPHPRLVRRSTREQNEHKGNYHHSHNQRQQDEVHRQQVSEEPAESWAAYIQNKVLGRRSHSEMNATVIKPGMPVEMSLERWLEHATVIENGGKMVALMAKPLDPGKFLLDHANDGVGRNEVQESPHIYPPYRVSGVELTLDLKWKNQLAHGYKSHNGTVLEIEVIARGGWHTTPQAYHIEPQDPATGKAKMVLRTFSGVSIRFTSSGEFSAVSFVAVATALSAMLVYIGLPTLIVNAVAMNCLGHASQYLSMAARQVLDPKDMLLGMAARSVALQKAFKEVMSKEEIEAELEKAFAVSSDLEPQVQKGNAQVIAKLLIKKYGDKDNSISREQLTDVCLSDEPLHMDFAAPLYCKTGHPTPGGFARAMEYMFVNNDDDDVNAANCETKEFEVKLVRKDGDSLGLDIDFSDPKTLTVTGISGGLVAAWNSSNPGNTVQSGDRIASVNGKTTVDEMLKECKEGTELTIVIKREVMPES
mmetsp:Transcript_10169/g.22502  ORF Transcript_10169/g.22502 Transcript_10169/m.22502 type:complete len:809 (-) Transcript_10169:73-2499(-)|eukprot:CAMPEP_0206429080 /NCGR_PEP_ID=MMETSP0324_2-20121206/6031_1 /ASSEMBLY_ACC=CAM_ASM_000836 /TAXON_ID=2866 /ORGANISM="Crypthecodinium cohnii, Strain Seligo" /LENGTH=808 /DNA_ID=CAMNT_0053894699 /DNA_START=105 /DNA_END=2531 /DNA_ORIENTATION=-